ncbi:MAG: hypothetical protein CM15mP85_17280 [Rhodobacterales bacterium]|nr:MAG: hypothetical protein CM15mP85_17280 [Rhodobacterales bacterium]
MKKNLHLSDFTNLASSSSIPKYYGEALVALAKENPRVVALTGDLAPATESDLFREAFPSRFFASGIAEANMGRISGGYGTWGIFPLSIAFQFF